MADKLIITYEEYKTAVEKLALEIEKSYKPTVLVGIMRGAAPIIDILSRIFKLPTAYVAFSHFLKHFTQRIVPNPPAFSLLYLDTKSFQ